MSLKTHLTPEHCWENPVLWCSPHHLTLPVPSGTPEPQLATMRFAVVLLGHTNIPAKATNPQQTWRSQAVTVLSHASMSLTYSQKRFSLLPFLHGTCPLLPPISPKGHKPSLSLAAPQVSSLSQGAQYILLHWTDVASLQPMNLYVTPCSNSLWGKKG